MGPPSVPSLRRYRSRASFGLLFGCVAPTRSSLLSEDVLLFPFIAMKNIKARQSLG